MATNKDLPKSQIEGLQTVVPTTVTDPRLTRRLSIANSADTNIYKQRFHVIMYYKNTSSEYSGWAFAGCAKESLGRALQEEPIVGGRLRRGGDDDILEIISNDGGVRMVEARIGVSLVEFLGLENKEEAEAELVFWKDIDDLKPEFYPLLYIQVTNFQCGGYSVGISCSLLPGDPSTIISFLYKWAKIHNNIFSKINSSKFPLFYLPNMRPNISPTNGKITSDPIKNHNESVILRAHKKDLHHDIIKEFVSICIEEAESELGLKTTSKICLFSGISLENVKVEKYSRESIANKFQRKIDRVTWNELGANEISFYEGNKPICVSHWLYSAPDEVLAIVGLSSNESTDSDQMNVIVSFPN